MLRMHIHTYRSAAAVGGPLTGLQDLDKFEKLAALPSMQEALADKYSKFDPGGWGLLGLLLGHGSAWAWVCRGLGLSVHLVAHMCMGGLGHQTRCNIVAECAEASFAALPEHHAQPGPVLNNAQPGPSAESN